ncbi:MAG: hypothetical protein DLM72_02675 [Candidatus Nitrosopolaris wilkensis]|nr:MAG: hypothetical protein DLM72_02675 [Candidatus Nitrosopolaris wilkensis]
MTEARSSKSQKSNRLKRFGYKYMGLAGGLWNLIWIIVAVIIIIILLSFLLHLLFILPTTITGAEQEIINTDKSISAILSSR